MESSPAVEHSDPSAEERIKLRLEIAELRSQLAWDRWLGRALTLVSTVVLVAGFLSGLSEYNDTNEQEYRQKFWEKRLEVYSTISLAAARTAVRRDPSERTEAFREFEQIYNGQIVLVADDSVALAAKNFYGTYIDFTHDPTKEHALPQAARSLALAARGSLARSSEGVLDSTRLTIY